MTNFYCLFFGLGAPFVLLIFFVRAVCCGRRLEAVLFGATFVHELLLIAMPVVYSVIGGFEFENAMTMTVTPEDLQKVLLGEWSFVLLFCLGYMGWRMVSAGGPSPRRIFTVGARADGIVMALLILAGWLDYVPEATGSPIFGQASIYGNWSLASSWIDALTWLPSLFACAYEVTRPGCLRKSPFRFLFAAGPLIAVAVIGATAGLRGRFGWIVSLLVICGYLQRNHKAIIGGALLLIAMLPVLSFLGSDYRGIYQAEISVGSSQADLLDRVTTEATSFVKGSSAGELFSRALSSLAERAQGPRNSAVLYRQHDVDGGVGWRTMVGSILFPVPRLLWPDKPMTGSKGKDESDSAVFIVMTEGHGDEGYMGPILASAHAYWEGGWVWLCLCGVGSGAFWSAAVNWAVRNKSRMSYMIVICLSGGLLIDGLFTMLIPTYSVILQCWKVLFPGYIILALIRRKQSRRTPQRPGPASTAFGSLKP